MSEVGISVSESESAETPVYIARDDQLIGVIWLSDQVKPGSAGAVALLTRNGVDSMLVSGDTEQTAQAVAAQVGIRRCPRADVAGGEV